MKYRPSEFENLKIGPRRERYFRVAPGDRETLAFVSNMRGRTRLLS
jgi:hypothetical protein